MNRKRTLCLLSIILVALAIWLEPTRVVWGWLRGEAFYQGRPTSYWDNELSYWEYGPSQESEGIDRWTGKPVKRWIPPHFSRNSNSFDDLADNVRDWFKSPKMGVEMRKLWREFENLSGPSLLKGDPAARDVLRELRHSAKNIGIWRSLG